MVDKFKYDKEGEAYTDKAEFVIVDDGEGKFHVELKEGHFGTILLKRKPKSIFKRIFRK